MDLRASRKFAVAPMMDWTDRHCRSFHRRLTRRALLFTEMIVAEAVIRGDRGRLLGFAEEDHPVVIQLGGSEPARLAEAARIAADWGYDEINLNVGCPSDRVRSGTFGACLMLKPRLVAECVAAMKAAVAVPVTIKCRIGVDEQDPEAGLDELADAVIAAGVDGIWVHARKAWLEGLSPKENREIPPLDYDRVRRLKQRLPDVFVGLNGGIADLDSASAELAGVDGVMLGRAAYQQPALLASVDRIIFHECGPIPAPEAVAEAMIPAIGATLADGAPLHRVTRHMLGLFHGRPGARLWRQRLGAEASKPGAGLPLYLAALAEVEKAEPGEAGWAVAAPWSEWISALA